ncbi:PREDICTED: O-acyltransferase WSD1-like [Camelina sativa]|uniref:O-acyltransferase WSD1-like n=1 Tax=Camelina sativa TaxID=90675 RepID=A0ABM0UIX2_CAMSA|nr:PREDICTED: O-acyltransferase WSD1-like [Camelina sativa]
MHMEEEGRMKNEEEEPVSPMARLFQSPDTGICNIINIGFNSKMNPDVVLHALRHNVHKHPRFCSKLSENGAKWIETEVNVEDHVIVPSIDPEEICDGGQSFVDDYISRLTMIPLDRSRPLWDIHILNVKTLDAKAVGIIRFNHALGDGMSFFSLVLACTHKTSNPDMLPTVIPSVKRRSTVSHRLEKNDWFLWAIFTIGSTLRLIWNTVVDMFLLFATMFFLKDTETPLKGGANVRSNPKRCYHRNISLDDIKLIKNAMNMTINDVLLGITQAALSSYMNRQYEQQDKNNEEDGALLTSYPNSLPDGIRFRAGCTVNLRPDIGFKPLAEMMVKDSKCRWGNYFSLIVLPLSIRLENDPLVHLKKTKAMLARKKHSYHAALAYYFIKICLKVFGAKVVSSLYNLHAMNTTACVSNVMGPTEEISFHGHPITYISPISYGHQYALFIIYTSYAGEMTITITVDPTIIPDPHTICDDMEESLKTMKAALWERGLL